MKESQAKLYIFNETPDKNIYKHICHNVYSKWVEGRFGRFSEVSELSMDAVVALSKLFSFEWAASVYMIENHLGSSQVPMSYTITTNIDVSHLNTKNIRFVFDNNFPVNKDRKEIDEWVLRENKSKYIQRHLEKCEKLINVKNTIKV